MNLTLAYRIMHVPDAFVRGISEKMIGRFSLGVQQNRLLDTGGFFV